MFELLSRNNFLFVSILVVRIDLLGAGSSLTMTVIRIAVIENKNTSWGVLVAVVKCSAFLFSSPNILAK